MFRKMVLAMAIAAIAVNVSLAVQPKAGEWEATGTGEWEDGAFATISFSFSVPEDQPSSTETVLSEITRTVPGESPLEFTAMGKVTIDKVKGQISCPSKPFMEGVFDSETTAYGTWSETFPATPPFLPQKLDVEGTWTALYTGPPVAPNAPVVSDIPDQTIGKGGAFAGISLDDYVSDPDNDDSQITWTYSGNVELAVSISHDRVAAVTVTNAEWIGSETVTFTATDPGGLSDSDSATFTVTPGLPPEISLSTTLLDFGTESTEDLFTISNIGGGVLEWRIVSDDLPVWLSVSPRSGQIPPGAISHVSVNVNRHGLDVGIYSYPIAITSNGGDGSVLVTVEQAEEADWYVATDGNDDNDGRSWARAKLTIQAAIDEAQFGDVIKVASGTYNESLELKNGLTLLGEGAQTTRIEYSGDYVVVDALEVTTGEVSGFTLAYTGSASNVVFWLRSSSFTITRNVIMGAGLSGIEIRDDSNPQITDNEIKDNRYYGIFMHERVSGTISGNVISGNESIGIVVGQNSQVEITNNEVKDNEEFGIVLYEGSRGKISQNTVSGSGYSGVIVESNSDPEITDNHIQNNGQAGIFVYARGRGTISGNVLSGNEFHGIALAENSNPKILNNQIKDNTIDGIYSFAGGRAGVRGTISGNVISGNGNDGISLRQNSDPEIKDNEITNNKYSGIYVYSGGLGKISENSISGNGTNGITIRTSSDPEITNNEITDNTENGISIHSGGYGTISENTISGNGFYGIEVKDNSAPQILDNEIKDSKHSGVYVSGRGTGVISGNVISGNASEGIVVKTGSAPKITGNEIRDNEHSGIYVYEEGGGTISENVVFGNRLQGIAIASDSDPEIKGNQIKSNEQNGILAFAGGHGTISENIIVDNGSHGIVAKENSDPQIVHNTIVSNHSNGVWVYLDSSPNILNNIIVENWANGIDTTYSGGNNGYPTVSYNDVWGNGRNYDGIDMPESDISVDPLFIDPANGDYRLQSRSPCRGAADDGSDLGAIQTPSLVILTPTDGQAFPPGTTSVTLTVKITNHTGTWRWKLDEPFPTSGPAGGNEVESGDTVNIRGLRDGRDYTVYAVLVDEEGYVLTPSESVSFSVGVVSPRRNLSITSVETWPGASESVQIIIDDATGIAGGDILIKYDQRLVTIGEVTSTDLLSSMSVIVNKDVPGQVKISMAGTEGIPSGGGVLANIVVTISTHAQVGIETTLGLDSNTQLYDQSGGIIPVNLRSGVVRITKPGIKGDVNSDGKVRSNDAILTLRIAAGLMDPTEYQKWAADMNSDGKIRSNDAILILRKAAGLAAPDVYGVAKDFFPRTRRPERAGEQVTITLAEAHGVAGERVTVPLKVDHIEGLAGGDVCIAYNGKVLRAVGVSSDPDVLLASNFGESGVIRIAFAGNGRAETQHAVSLLAEIHFDILADYTSPLTFKSVELYSSDALPLRSRSIDKSFRSWAIAPEYSALLQNFPNPFNPETWIPYQLEEDAEIAIRIYNVTGELIRELDLGHKPAGLYVSQDRAAYWDGRNNLGIPVASGVYFYSIHAGDFSAVRKLTILK